MGTMLQVTARESAKQFYEMYMLNPKHSQRAPGAATSTSMTLIS